MRAAILLGGSKSRVDRVPIPPLGSTDVLVRLEGTGVCASNVPVWEGRDWFHYPAEPGAPGHEGWGVVECVGDGVTATAPGRRVALLSSRSYAQYDVTDQGSIVELPHELDDVDVPGEPLACAVAHVDSACERLSGHIHIVELVWQFHDRSLIGDVVLCVRARGQQRHASPRGSGRHSIADAFHDAPAFMAGRTRFGRIVKPVSSFPHRHVRGADTRTF